MCHSAECALSDGQLHHSAFWGSLHIATKGFLMSSFKGQGVPSGSSLPVRVHTFVVSAIAENVQLRFKEHLGSDQGAELAA